MNNPVGSSHGRAKLKEDQIPLIRKHLDKGQSYGWIAIKFNVNPQTIYRIAKGETWQHVPIIN